MNLKSYICSVFPIGLYTVKLWKLCNCTCAFFGVGVEYYSIVVSIIKTENQEP